MFLATVADGRTTASCMGRREEKLQKLNLNALLDGFSLGGPSGVRNLCGSSQKGGFQKGGFGGCSLDPQNRNEGTKNGMTAPKNGTRVPKRNDGTKKPERGYKKSQHHPFTKPP